MKSILAFIITITTAFQIHSKDFIQFKSSQFISSEDSLPAYNKEVLKTIGEKLGMEPIPNLHPSLKMGYSNKKAQLGFSYFEIALQSNHIHKNIIEELHLNVSLDTCYLAGFNTWLPDSRKAKRNFYRFLASAYEQERKPEIKNNDSMFIDLEEKTAKELTRRTWILPIKGITYIRYRNPFFRPNNIWIYLEAIEEAGFLSAVILPPFLCKRTQDKIGLPVLGLVGLVEFRWLMDLSLQKDMKKYSLIKSSGYRIPRNVECPDCLKN